MWQTDRQTDGRTDRRTKWSLSGAPLCWRHNKCVNTKIYVHFISLTTAIWRLQKTLFITKKKHTHTHKTQCRDNGLFIETNHTNVKDLLEKLLLYNYRCRKSWKRPFFSVFTAKNLSEPLNTYPTYILCRLRSIAARSNHFVRRLSVRPSFCLSGSHTVLVVTLSWLSSIAMFRRWHMHSSDPNAATIFFFIYKEQLISRGNAFKNIERVFKTDQSYPKYYFLGHRSQRLQWPIVITRCPA